MTRRTPLSFLALCLLASSAFTLPAHAGEPLWAVEEAKLVAEGLPDTAYAVGGQRAIAWDGDQTVLVGRPDDGAGAVHIYELSDNGWTLEQTLRPLSGDQNFGQSVYLHPERAYGAVQSLTLDSSGMEGTGALSIIERSASGAWSIVERVEAPEGENAWGYDVAFEGSCMVVSGLDGKAYAYHRSRTPAGSLYGPPQQIMVDPFETEEQAGYDDSFGGGRTGFGTAVALYNDLAFVSDVHDSEDAHWAGAVHVFDLKEGGELVQTLRHPAPPVAFDGSASYAGHFGQDLAVDGGRLVVSAGGNSDLDTRVTTWVPDGRSWRLEALLEAPESAHELNYGSTVAILGDLIVVGAPDMDVRGQVFGYRLQGGEWAPMGPIVASGAVARPGDLSGDAFGGEVLLGCGLMLVGAPNDGADRKQRGAVYVFDISTQSCPTPDPLPEPSPCEISRCDAPCASDCEPADRNVPQPPCGSPRGCGREMPPADVAEEVVADLVDLAVPVESGVPVELTFERVTVPGLEVEVQPTEDVTLTFETRDELPPVQAPSHDPAPADPASPVDPGAPTDPIVPLDPLAPVGVVLGALVEVSPTVDTLDVRVPELPDGMRYVHVDPIASHEAAVESVRIEIAYDPEQLEEDGLEPTDLAIHFFDGREWVDISVLPEDSVVPATEAAGGDLTVLDSGISQRQGIVWVEVDHTSTYALGPHLSVASTSPGIGASLSGGTWVLLALAGMACLVWAGTWWAARSMSGRHK